jgi:hypothetical protein
MSKKSFINKLSERLSEPAEKSSEELDRELAASVEAIKAEKVETLEGEKVLSSGDDSKAGGKVYILDLDPLYGLIGGSEGRLAENLRENCDKEFAGRSVEGRDQATLEGDLFVMRFAGISDQEGFILAATIVNTIGKELLGSRFETMEVPDLLVVASAAVAFNPDGSPNLAAMRTSVKDGGLPVSMTEPDDDAPRWVKLRWKKEVRDFQRRTQEFKAKSEAAQRPSGDADEYVKYETDNRRVSIRRVQTKSFEGEDKRQTLERRSRGY